MMSERGIVYNLESYFHFDLKLHITFFFSHGIYLMKNWKYLKNLNFLFLFFIQYNIL